MSVIWLQSRFYLGEVGNGAAMKLVVNMIMGRLVLTKKSPKCLVAPKPLHIPDNHFELQFLRKQWIFITLILWGSFYLS